MDWTTVIVGFAGGVFGACIGALPAFIFTGVTLFVGIAIALAGGGTGFLDIVALGPFFGPQAAFAGGVAAAAFAARRGHILDGRDIAAPLAELSRLAPLIVGGVFGAGGTLIVLQFGKGLSVATDPIAFTVMTLGVVARLSFGRKGLFGQLPPGTSLRRRFTPTEDEAWVPHQRKLPVAAFIGAVTGLLSSYVAVELLAIDPAQKAAAGAVGFAMSAVCLLFAYTGRSVPVTHHMTLTAATAAIASGNIFVGSAVGLTAALFGEFVARAVHNHGDTHIDPPAVTITFVTTGVLASSAIF
jgi:hypothetical protein